MTATSASGTINITDDEGLLFGDSVQLKIVKTSTNKVVVGPVPYTGLNFDFSVEPLESNTEYRLIVSAIYIVNEKEYTKDFISKVFVSDNIGLSLEKAYATETVLAFKVTKESYSSVDVAGLQLYDAKGEQHSVPNVSVARDSEVVEFDNLTPNTTYQVQFCEIKGGDEDAFAFLWAEG